MVAVLQGILFRGNSATRIIHSTSIQKTIASSLPRSPSLIGLHYCQLTRDFSSEFSDLRPGERIVINPSSHQKKGGANKSKITPKKSPPFIDKIRLRVRGGMGGAGCLSHAKLGSYKQKPNGGHGGRGGSVFLVTDPRMSSLKMEKHHFTGQDGGRGSGNGMNGRNGKDVFVRVPCGVVVKQVLDVEDEEDEDYLNGFGEIEVEGMDEVNNSFDVDEQQSNGSDEQDELIDESDNEDEESNEVMENEFNVEDDFDSSYTEMLSSSKRQRKRAMRRGKLPSDYDSVIEEGVRSQDGMFYWGTADDDIDEDDDTFVSSSSHLDPSNQKKRKTVFLADLDQLNASLLVAKGGKAGVGNQAYANRPYFASRDANAAKKAIPGEGECAFLELELKLIADVGLVGFPNAGKSSLLSAMSRARPKIASYPFTTLHPLVGTIQYRDGFKLVMADVPGLIDGAATEGRGRGIEFLRHIERTKALVYIVDAAGVDGRNGIDDLKVLGKELREYGSSGIVSDAHMEDDDDLYDGGREYHEELMRRRREIMKRPSLILANKMDLLPQDDVGLGRIEELLFQLSEAAKEVGISCQQENILGISAGVSGEGLRELSKKLRHIVTAA
mmetsp:Transcript_18198/g.37262  ORF Transcript_18198/g.37262 Transcript_18198/m.37262 type:complete len:612 (-) Transcript_18198:121-1956(-)